MTQTFKVGDKVTHRSAGHGEITYGPFLGAFDSARYLMRATDGREWVAGAIELTAVPAFTVGDTVTSVFTSTSYEVLAGPFRSDEVTWYAVRHEDGREIKCGEWQLKPAPVTVDDDEIKPGDRVRVLAAAHRKETVGKIYKVLAADGSVTFHDPDVPGVHRYKVQAETGDIWSGTFYARDVERVTNTSSTPYAHDGTIYNLSAKYTDRGGDVWRFALIDGEAYGSCDGEAYEITAEYGTKLETAVRNWGPLTKVGSANDGNTVTHNDAVYMLGVRYLDSDGDGWTFERRDGRVVSAPGSWSRGKPLAVVVDNYGPLTTED